MCLKWIEKILYENVFMKIAEWDYYKELTIGNIKKMVKDEIRY